MRQGRKAMGLVRAGAKRLHGHRFPPEGPGLDATGAAGPIKTKEGQPQAVIASRSARDRYPKGEDTAGGFVRLAQRAE